jgi:hypothetical protein
MRTDTEKYGKKPRLDSLGDDDDEDITAANST